MTDTHIPFTPNDFQRANLLRLAAHLDLGVTNMRFDMQSYSDAGLHECGTVGCAVGHLPTLGVAPLPGERWYEYGCRCLCDAGEAYLWLFGNDWADYGTDNTARGAAARIHYALKHGVPENYRKQMLGFNALSYTVPDRVEGPSITIRSGVIA